MSTIVLTQKAPPVKTAAHDVENPVISPLLLSGFSPSILFQEIRVTGRMREFLFEMRKDGAIYWVGAAVPEGTTDFSKVQVYFHPTVVQDQTVHAADTDYPAFRGGWSASIQRYVEMQGGQLAAVRQTTLIVPFTTMAAGSGQAPHYMFATRPVETLGSIMAAIEAEVNSVGVNEVGVEVSQIGVSSFSSGIGAMRSFIKTFGATGLIKETTDFDSGFIVAEPKILTRSPGAVARAFSQVPSRTLEPGWMHLPAQNFRDIHTFKSKGVHAQIGWMTYYLASGTSIIF